MTLVTRDHTARVLRAQQETHGEQFDYDKGSPHLRHARLRAMVEERLRAQVLNSIGEFGACRVVEIGAGHGTFTRCLADAGAQVTVTEASPASVKHLRRHFAGDGRVQVVYDESGESVFSLGQEWDLAVLISVLHHIPDYVSFLDRLCGCLRQGGGIFTAQDPLYYPRMSKLAHAADRSAYMAWRVFQGNFGRGVATRVRRLRGVYDDKQPSDLVEYHVVRDGVDEEAIRELLADRFTNLEIVRYWSTQAPMLQRVGERLGLESSFGISAQGLK